MELNENETKQQKYSVAVSGTALEQLEWLATELGVAKVDVVRESLSILVWLAREVKSDHQLVIARGDRETEMVISLLERLRPVRVGH